MPANSCELRLRLRTSPPRSLCVTGHQSWCCLKPTSRLLAEETVFALFHCCAKVKKPQMISILSSASLIFKARMSKFVLFSLFGKCLPFSDSSSMGLWEGELNLWEEMKRKYQKTKRDINVFRIRTHPKSIEMSWKGHLNRLFFNHIWCSFAHRLRFRNGSLPMDSGSSVHLPEKRFDLADGNGLQIGESGARDAWATHSWRRYCTITMRQAALFSASSK